MPEPLFITMCAVAAFAVFGQLAHAVISMAEEVNGAVPADNPTPMEGA